MMDIMVSLSGMPRSKFIQSREFPLPMCRAIVYKRLIRMGYSTMRVGRFFNKTHATVLHGVKQLDNLLDTKDGEVVLINQSFDYLMKTPNE